MVFTLIIIAITVLLSVSAFSNETLYQNFILWPKRMTEPKEYYRLLSSGFVHADWQHLIFNMLTLYFFGRNMEYITDALGKPWMFLFLYLTAIVISSLPSFVRNRNNGYYRSLGASGGVSAVLFATIYYSPWAKVYLMYAIGIPSIIFAVAYLAYSVYMDKNGQDNVNHNAHLWGAIYGLLIAWSIDPTHGLSFWYQITNPHF